MAKKKAGSASSQPQAASSSGAAASTAALDTVATNEPKRRWLSRRDTEQQVERSLKSPHFRHISEVTLANRIVDGKNIRQALTDLIHGLGKGQRIGSNTYSMLAEKYSDGNTKVEGLRPSNDQEPINEELVKLLSNLQADTGLAKSAKCLQAFLQSCAELSQRNLVGLVKVVFAPKMLARPDPELRTMAVMSYCARCLEPLHLPKKKKGEGRTVCAQNGGTKKPLQIFPAQVGG